MANRKIQNNTAVRKHTLKKNFGLSLAQYDLMFNEQGGCCAICGRHQSELKKALAVDHDHKTGNIRKLLCARCNILLGFAKDNVELLEASIKYLNDFQYIIER
jgi:hypothetical protein